MSGVDLGTEIDGNSACRQHPSQEQDASWSSAADHWLEEHSLFDSASIQGHAALASDCKALDLPHVEIRVSESHASAVTRGRYIIRTSWERASTCAAVSTVTVSSATPAPPSSPVELDPSVRAALGVLLSFSRAQSESPSVHILGLNTPRRGSARSSYCHHPSAVQPHAQSPLANEPSRYPEHHDVIIPRVASPKRKRFSAEDVTHPTRPHSNPPNAQITLPLSRQGPCISRHQSGNVVHRSPHAPPASQRSGSKLSIVDMGEDKKAYGSTDLLHDIASMLKKTSPRGSAHAHPHRRQIQVVGGANRAASRSESRAPGDFDVIAEMHDMVLLSTLLQSRF
ncbi:hypothetical protein CERSUDRAFT_74492 [Gelatoporia subvermispora B]|uniref:Uncharacterized protein n=1 Tax=Ceriporiopsis subvermispora (strain B) TaxID=914234 RepID=M2RDN7_CERS8|nr:hypothetical protein CERSUDRAFT_74492 [Gelatoporia subvermispora B]